MVTQQPPIRRVPPRGDLAGSRELATREARYAAMSAIGKKRWAIPEGYIPPGGVEDAGRALVSHEAACILNAGDDDAHVALTVYFVDREPAGPYRVTVGARRTLHLRFNDLDDPEAIPAGTPYASVFESDVPIVLQHTRLDSRRAEIALLSTIAYTE